MADKTLGTMCDMCQKLTPDAIKASPQWGLPHYNSLHFLLEGTSKLECHLCSLIWKALQDYLLDGDFALRITQKPPLAIRVFETEHNLMGFACGVWNSDLNEWDRCDMGEFRSRRPISLIDKEEPYSTSKFGPSPETALVPPYSSSITYKFIKSWLETCQRGHSNVNDCRIASTSGRKYCPKRLLDVGSETRDPYLMETDSIDVDVKYVALSYCWGRLDNFTSTSTTLEQRKARIPLNALPKTIKDAVEITRELGIRFLWVDAICILQGNDKDAVADWQMQSAMMGEIYGNSYLTIAAAAATGVHKGIFQESEAFKEYQDSTFPTGVDALTFAYVTPPSRRKYNHDIISEPLYKRAWALQERILSRRVVTYGTDRITWQCRTRSYTESGTAPPETFSLLNPFELGFLGVFWSRLVTRYSQCALTYGADKLPALSGLVKAIKLNTGSTYLAGLWKETIFDNLLWKVRAPGLQKRPLAYRAPSWSWASLDGPIDLDFATYPGSYAVALGYDVTAAGLDTTGEILGGWLEVRGALKPLVSVFSQRIQTDPTSQLLETNLFFDDARIRKNDVFCLQLKYEGGLLLVHSGRDDRSYIRVGMFKLSEEYFEDSVQETVKIF